ncbi:MAG: ABC transporter substrate-binding protein [Micromonosporaceae bacterium]|nr:ABC transporter substrate-binding protein [Micromonosporaceae bacterium]
MRVRLVVAATAALPVVVAGGLAGCTDRPDPAPNPDPVVRVAIGVPPSLVPTEVAGGDGGDGAQVLAALFTPLVGFDDAGRPVPVAAESVRPSPDSRVWTITLRGGYTFHNGELVTADRYLEAWNYGAYQPNGQQNNYYFQRIEGYPALNPPGGGAPTAPTLSGLAKVDDRTFTVTLAEPFVEFASLLGAPAFYPLPAAAFTPGGEVRDEFAAAPVGNGPFRMVGRQPGELIDIERYPRHPGDPAQVGKVRFQVYPDDLAAYADLLAGDVDLVTRIPAGRLATVEADLGDRFLRVPGPGFQFLAFPSYQPELANPDIRRAISMAIDRDEIVAGVFRGTESTAHSFVPPVVPGAQDGGCGPACRHDPATARDLYARAGGPAQLTIGYNADGGHRDWVEMTCDQLRTSLRVGCQGVPVPHVTDLLDRLANREPVGIVRLGWAMDYPSMESYLAPLFSTGGSANLHGYHNPELDALLASAAAAASPAEAQASYRRAEQILARDLPVIPLRFGSYTIGHSERVREVTVTTMGQLDLTRVTCC